MTFFKILGVSPPSNVHPKLRALTKLSVVLGVFFLSMVSISASSARASSAPGWMIRSVALPTNFKASDNASCEALARCDEYLVTATNVGSAASNGEAIVLNDTLPAHIVVHEVAAREVLTPATPPLLGPKMKCTGTGAGDISVQCETDEVVPPGDVVVLAIEVTVEPGVAATVLNQAEIIGGGAPTAVTSLPTTVSNTVDGAPPTFALQDVGMGVFDSAGKPDTQAGDHPGALTSTLNYTTVLKPEEIEFPTVRLGPTQEPKTELVHLPLGVAGDVQAASLCPEAVLYGTNEGGTHCPVGSQLGTVTIESNGLDSVTRLFNVTPQPGYPAEFGFEVAGALVFLRAELLPGSSGYGLTVSASNIPRSLSAIKVSGVTVMFFGDPGVEDGASEPSQAFLTNPTDCQEGPLVASIETNSWVQPGRWLVNEAKMFEATPEKGLTGCELVSFDPAVSVEPEESWADTPSGYGVTVSVPQAPNLAPNIASADLRTATVTLPLGVSLSPGAADGLVGCEEEGPNGIDLGDHDTVGHDVQAGEEVGPDGVPHAAPGHCPQASQVGDVEVTTPLLRAPLKGHLFLAQPHCGGEGQPVCTEASAENGELFGVYLEVAGSGVVVKLRGGVSASVLTGQLTTTFAETPQLPFAKVRIGLKGGPRAPLSNPQGCGLATTTSALVPWSAPFTPDATPSSSFTIDEGCGSSGFAPVFSAGSVNPQAGAFSPFTTTFSRSDREQDLSGVRVITPPGFSGMLSSVPLCGEPLASQGACPASSEIGHVTVGAGAGSDPVYLPVAGQPSNPVYLTTGYRGAPFGLSVVVPAVAGPFDLGNVVVRAAISVDPHTAQVSIVSDPLPQILDGVPLRVKTVNVMIDRPGFTFNPTNCEPLKVTGSIASAQGASVAVSSPFQAANCANLPFKPRFSASTQGKTSKANGASLTVRVTSTLGQANIHRVDLQLPKVLPARLTTLQKACTAVQFEANPAGCPAGSVIGMATAHTPVLGVPLTGPAYLVSHGGAAFPDVEFVLQANERGGDVEIVLDGGTQIKHGITYSHFETVPDAPISSFETVLPEGLHSALGTDIPVSAKNSLCGRSLAMPTTLTGQNGAVIHQSTRIAVTGCAKRRSLTRAQKLTAALKLCRKQSQGRGGPRQRAACEHRARRRYGPLKQKRKKK